MLDVESRDDIDYTKLTSAAVNKLTRMVAKTPVSPMMEQQNPAKQALLRDLKNVVRKAEGNCAVYATFTNNKITLSDIRWPGPHVYKLVFRNAELAHIDPVRDLDTVN